MVPMAVIIYTLVTLFDMLLRFSSWLGEQPEEPTTADRLYFWLAAPALITIASAVPPLALGVRWRTAVVAGFVGQSPLHLHHLYLWSVDQTVWVGLPLILIFVVNPVLTVLLTLAMERQMLRTGFAAETLLVVVSGLLFPLAWIIAPGVAGLLMEDLPAHEDHNRSVDSPAPS
jgi:hypothetical protein